MCTKAVKNTFIFISNTLDHTKAFKKCPCNLEHADADMFDLDQWQRSLAFREYREPRTCSSWMSPRHIMTQIWGDIALLQCKAKRQYLLTLHISRYCLLALQSALVRSRRIRANDVFDLHHRVSEVKRQYLFTCKVSRYCLLALHNSTCSVNNEYMHMDFLQSVDIIFSFQSAAFTE